MPTCTRNPDDAPAPKRHKLSVEIRDRLLTQQFIDDFKQKWHENAKFNADKVEVITDPFHICVINDFLDNGLLLDAVRNEFYELDWNVRSMDLFEFFQSKDLKYLGSSAMISALHRFLERDVMNWVIICDHI